MLQDIYKIKKGETKSLNQTWFYDKSDVSEEILIKAVVEEGGFFEANGMLKIATGIKNIDIFLRYKVLLLGKGAGATVNPQLEIESNEVKAGHAASIGRIDEEQLFYLMSRGLNKDEATKLIVEAFLK